MKALALAPVLALAALAFAPPQAAFAEPRRDRGHRSFHESRDWGRRPIVGYRHYDRDHRFFAHRDRFRPYYGAYGYRYIDPVPYYDSGYYYDPGYYAYVPPPPRVFRYRVHRPHVGVFLGF